MNPEIKKGLSPLHLSTIRKQERITKLLLLYGAQINAKSHEEITPITLTSYDKEETIKPLFQDWFSTIKRRIKIAEKWIRLEKEPYIEHCMKVALEALKKERNHIKKTSHKTRKNQYPKSIIEDWGYSDSSSDLDL